MVCCHVDCHRGHHTFCWQETRAAACKVWREFAETQLAQSMSLQLLGAQHDEPELMTARQETVKLHARAMMGKMCREIETMVYEKRVLQEQKDAAVADRNALAQAAAAKMQVLDAVEPLMEAGPAVLAKGGRCLDEPQLGPAQNRRSAAASAAAH